MSDDGGFDLRLLGPTPADNELGRELFQQGASFQTIRQRLVQTGLKPEHAETVILEIAGREVQSLVVAGSSHAVIFDRLAPRGLNEQQVTAVIDKLTKKTSRRASSAARSATGKYDYLYKTVTGRMILWIGRKLRILG